MIAAALAAVSGLLWFIFRGKKAGIIMRQIFFATAAYIAAHLLLAGFAPKAGSASKEETRETEGKQKEGNGVCRRTTKKKAWTS